MDTIKTWALRVGLGLALGCAWPGLAQGQGALSLSLSPGSITFPTADPDVTPVIVAPPLSVQVYCRRAPWQLTVIAGGDLTSGASSIPISNVAWTAAPAPPFRNGVMSRTVAQMVATDSSPVDLTATVVYSLVNSWTYNTGTYSVTITYTLSTI